MHVGSDFDQVMVRRAEYPQQFDAGALQTRIVRTVGQRHLSPVDNALHADTMVAGMYQVAGKVIVVDAIDADLDRAEAVWVFILAAHDLVDVIVYEALGVIGMVLLSLGELGSQVQRFEMMVVPIDIALELPGIPLVRTVRVAGCPFRGDSSVLRMFVPQLGPVHEDILHL